MLVLAADAFVHTNLGPPTRYFDVALLGVMGVGMPVVTWTHWFGLSPKRNWAIKRRLVIGPQALVLEFADAPPFSEAWNDPAFFVSIIEWGDSSWRARSGVTIRLWGGLAPYFEVPPEAQQALERALEPWHYEKHVYTPADPAHARYAHSVHYMRPGQELNSFSETREPPPV